MSLTLGLQLTCLEISKISLDDDQLESIAINLPSIERLVLAECQGSTDPRQISVLQSLKGMRQLSLTRWNHLADAGLIPVVAALPNLTNLNVDGCSSLTNELLFVVAQHCTALQVLVLAHNGNFSDPGVCALAEGTLGIRTLDLTSVPRLSDQALISLARYQPLLEELSLANCPRITEKGLVKLQGLARIKIQLEASQNKLFLKELSAKSRESSRARSFSDIEQYIARLPRTMGSSPLTPELRAKFDTMARHHLAEEGDEDDVAYEPFTTKFTFEELKRGDLVQCDPSNLERYLAEDEFHRLFEIPIEDFTRLPLSQQRRMKHRLHLY